MRTSKAIAATMIALSYTASAASGIEQLIPDFPRCKTGNFFLDPATQEPQHDYLRALKPYKVEDGFAHYKVKTTYHGLPVTELMIPASTWGVFALTFAVPLHESRAHLKTKVGLKFLSIDDADTGQLPVLHEDFRAKGRSIIACTNPH